LFNIIWISYPLMFMFILDKCSCLSLTFDQLAPFTLTLPQMTLLNYMQYTVVTTCCDKAAKIPKLF
jgi:hypothetical protein